MSEEDPRAEVPSETAERFEAYWRKHCLFLARLRGSAMADPDMLPHTLPKYVRRES